MEVTRAHSLLGVRAGASHSELRSAYRTQLRRVHPDAGGAGDPAAIQSIRGAYRTLVADAARRRPVAEPAVTRRPAAEPVERRHIDVYA